MSDDIDPYYRSFGSDAADPARPPASGGGLGAFSDRFELDRPELRVEPPQPEPDVIEPQQAPQIRPTPELEDVEEAEILEDDGEALDLEEPGEAPDPDDPGEDIEARPSPTFRDVLAAPAEHGEAFVRDGLLRSYRRRPATRQPAQPAPDAETQRLDDALERERELRRERVNPALYEPAAAYDPSVRAYLARDAQSLGAIDAVLRTTAAGAAIDTAQRFDNIQATRMAAAAIASQDGAREQITAAGAEAARRIQDVVIERIRELDETGRATPGTAEEEQLLRRREMLTRYRHLARLFLEAQSFELTPINSYATERAIFAEQFPEIEDRYLFATPFMQQDIMSAVAVYGWSTGAINEIERQLPGYETGVGAIGEVLEVSASEAGRLLVQHGRSIGEHYAVGRIQDYAYSPVLRAIVLGDPRSVPDLGDVDPDRVLLDAISISDALLDMGAIDADSALGRSDPAEWVEGALQALTAEQREELNSRLLAPLASALVEDAQLESASVGSAAEALTPNIAPGILRDYVLPATTSTIQIAPALVVSALTGSPTPTLAMAGYLGFGAGAEGARREGLSQADASIYAMGYAAAEIIPEFFSVRLFLRNYAAIRARPSSIGRAVGSQSVAEAIQEGVTEALQIGLDAAYIDEEITVGEAMQRIAHAAVIGGISGPMMIGGAAVTVASTRAPGAVYRRFRDAFGSMGHLIRKRALGRRVAEIDADMRTAIQVNSLNSLSEAAKGMRAAQESPEIAERWIERRLEEDAETGGVDRRNIYFDASQAVEHEGFGQTVADRVRTLSRITGVPEAQINEARRTPGSHVRVPTAQYLVRSADAPEVQYFADVFTFSPDIESLQDRREARRLRRRLSRGLLEPSDESLITSLGDPPDPIVGEREVFENFYRQLVRIDPQRKSQVELQARIVTAMLRTAALRDNRSIQELADRYFAGVRRQPTVGQVPRGRAEASDPAPPYRVRRDAQTLQRPPRRAEATQERQEAAVGQVERPSDPEASSAPPDVARLAADPRAFLNELPAPIVRATAEEHAARAGQKTFEIARLMRQDLTQTAINHLSGSIASAGERARQDVLAGLRRHATEAFEASPEAAALQQAVDDAISDAERGAAEARIADAIGAQAAGLQQPSEAELGAAERRGREAEAAGILSIMEDVRAKETPDRRAIDERSAASDAEAARAAEIVRNYENALIAIGRDAQRRSMEGSVLTPYPDVSAATVEITTPEGETRRLRVDTGQADTLARRVGVLIDGGFALTPIGSLSLSDVAEDAPTVERSEAVETIEGFLGQEGSGLTRAAQAEVEQILARGVAAPVIVDLAPGSKLRAVTLSRSLLNAYRALGARSVPAYQVIRVSETPAIFEPGAVESWVYANLREKGMAAKEARARAREAQEYADEQKRLSAQSDGFAQILQADLAQMAGYDRASRIIETGVDPVTGARLQIVYEDGSVNEVANNDLFEKTRHFWSNGELFAWSPPNGRPSINEEAINHLVETMKGGRESAVIPLGSLIDTSHVSRFHRYDFIRDTPFRFVRRPESSADGWLSADEGVSVNIAHRPPTDLGALAAIIAHEQQHAVDAVEQRSEPVARPFERYLFERRTAQQNTIASILVGVPLGRQAMAEFQALTPETPLAVDDVVRSIVKNRLPHIDTQRGADDSYSRHESDAYSRRGPYFRLVQALREHHEFNFIFGNNPEALRAVDQGRTYYNLLHERRARAAEAPLRYGGDPYIAESPAIRISDGDRHGRGPALQPPLPGANTIETDIRSYAVLWDTAVLAIEKLADTGRHDEAWIKLEATPKRGAPWALENRAAWDLVAARTGDPSATFEEFQRRRRKITQMTEAELGNFASEGRELSSELLKELRSFADFLKLLDSQPIGFLNFEPQFLNIARLYRRAADGFAGDGAQLPLHVQNQIMAAAAQEAARSRRNLMLGQAPEAAPDARAAELETHLGRLDIEGVRLSRRDPGRGEFALTVEGARQASAVEATLVEIYGLDAVTLSPWSYDDATLFTREAVVDAGGLPLSVMMTPLPLDRAAGEIASARRKGDEEAQRVISEAYNRVDAGLRHEIENATSRQSFGQLDIASSNFTNWFRDSKIVDENGQPQVYYHGTNHSFDTFDLSITRPTISSNASGVGFFTPDLQFASKFATDDGGNFMPVYLRVENPMSWSEAAIDQLYSAAFDTTLEGAPKDWRGHTFDQARDSQYIKASDVFQDEAIARRLVRFFNEANDRLQSNALNEDGIEWKQAEGLVRAFEAAGFDGFYEEETIITLSDPRNPISWVRHSVRNVGVFRPEQVKSAIGNRGTYDPSDANILHQTDISGLRGQAKPLEGNEIEGFRKFEISLTDLRDLSTFIHEAAHPVLEMYLEMAQRPGSSQEVRDDVAALMRFAGVNWGQLRTKEGRHRFHETIAPALEEYMRQGKAPVPWLRDVFARVMRWITEVYKQIVGGVGGEVVGELGPAKLVRNGVDVREYFDRWFALRSEIEAAREQMGFLEIFQKESDIGFAAGEFDTYRELAERAQNDVFERAISGMTEALKADQRAIYEDRLRRQLVQSRQALRQTPLYAAFFRFIEGAKISAEALRAQYPDIDLTALPKFQGKKIFGEATKARRVIDGETQLVVTDPTQTRAGVQLFTDVDIAARQAGYSQRRGGAAQMLADFLDMTPFEEAARRNAEDAVREFHPEALDTSEATETVRDLLHSDATARMLEYEQRILGELAGQLGITRKTAALIAGDMLGEMKIEEVLPRSFLLQERRLAVLAQKEAAKIARIANKRSRDALKHLNALLRIRQQQLVAFEMYRQGREIENQVRSARKRYARWSKQIKRLRQRDKVRQNTIAPEYLEQMRALFDRYGFTQISRKERERQQSFAAWVAQMREEGRDGELVDIPDHMMSSIGRINYKDLSVEEFRGLIETLENLAYLGGLKDRLRRAQKLRERERKIDAMVEGVGERAFWVDADQPTDTRTPLRRVHDWVSAFFLTGIDAVTIAREQIDAGQEMGAAYEALISPAQIGMRALPEAHVANSEALNKIDNLLTPQEREGANRKARVPSTTLNLSLNQRLAVGLNMGSKSNREALYNSPLFRGESGAARVQAILDTLEQRHWDWIQATWDHIGSFRDRIGAVEKEITGVEPPWIEPSEVETRFGAYGGGYYPLRYADGNVRHGGPSDVITEGNFIEGGLARQSARLQTASGFAKARVGSAGREVLLDVRVREAHLNAALYHIHMGAAVAQIGQIIRNPRFRSEMERAGRRVGLTELDKYIVALANGEQGPRSAIDHIARTAKTNVTFAALAYSIPSAAINASGIANTIGRLGLRRGDVVIGAKEMMLNAVNGWREVYEESPVMRQRRERGNKEMSDAQKAESANLLAQAFGLVSGRAKRAALAFTEYGYALMAVSQMPVDLITYYAARRRGLKMFESLPDAERLSKAIEYAEGVVEESQSAQSFIRLSSIERGQASVQGDQSQLLRSLSVLMSYMRTKPRILYGKTARIGDAIRERSLAGSAIATADFVKTAMFVFAIEAAIVLMIRSALRGDEDDDESFVEAVALETLKTVAGSFSILTGVAAEAQGFRGGGGLGALEKSFGSFITQAGQGEADESFIKALIGAGSMITPFPGVVANRAVSAYFDELEGEDIAPMHYITGPPR